MTLLNIEKLSAVACIVKQHRLASVLRQFGKIRWAHENNFVGRMAPRFCMASHCESRYSREGQLYDSNDLFSVHCISPFPFVAFLLSSRLSRMKNSASNQYFLLAINRVDPATASMNL